MIAPNSGLSSNPSTAPKFGLKKLTISSGIVLFSAKYDIDLIN